MSNRSKRDIFSDIPHLVHMGHVENQETLRLIRIRRNADGMGREDLWDDRVSCKILYDS